ncbi:MAG: hypothetical protein VW268_09435 [Rhodospirillaceae bacterium]
MAIHLRNAFLTVGVKENGKTTVYDNNGPDEKHPTYGELPWPVLVWAQYDDVWKSVTEPPKNTFEWKHQAPPPTLK